MTVFVEDHPLIKHKLGLMRQKDISTKDFRDLASEVARLLTYEATKNLVTEKKTIEGWAVLNIDERGVGQFSTIATSPESAANQINLAFRIRSGTIKFATNAFFFQEGTGELYERARYGEFRLNPKGEPLLVGLRDENLVKLVNVESAE